MHPDLAVALAATQFAANEAINLILSLRLGQAMKLGQWVLFAGVAVLAAIGLASP